MSIAPAVADVSSSSRPGLRVGETQVSRIYRIRWAKAFARAQDRNSQATKSSLGSERRFVFSLDGARADAKSIAATVREIVARAEAEILPALDRPYLVKRRLHVRCKAKYVVAARKQPSHGLPALMQAALAEQEPVVLKSKRVYTVRYRLSRAVIAEVDGKRDFVITLPDLTAAAEQPRPASSESPIE